MLIQEMIDLSNWFNEKEKFFSPLAKLDKLLQILKSNTQARSPSNRNIYQVQAFTNEKNEAIEAVEKYDIAELSNNQINCLAAHNANNFMGKQASNIMSDFFRNEVHDMAFLAEQVQQAYDSIRKAKEAINAVSISLMPYYEKITNTDYLEDTARFSIIFKDGVQIESLKDLESRSKEWSKIMHGIGVALDISPTEFKVLGARNGSFILDLYMCAAAIVPVGFILNRTLSIIEKFAITIKRLKSIYDLDISEPVYDEIRKQIETTNEKYFNIKKTISSKQIASEILDERNVPDNKRPEAQLNLESSIKKILNHLKNGGDLDAFVPSEQTNDDQNPSSEAERATILINEFRSKKLEYSKEEIIKLLEHIDFESDSE